MSFVRKLLIGCVAAFVAYLSILFVLNYALQSKVEERVKKRLRDVLAVDSVEVEKVELSLIRGNVHISGISAKRTKNGTVNLEVKSVSLSGGALGGLLFGRDLSQAIVSGGNLELSALGASKIRSGESSALRIDSFLLRNSMIEVHLTSYLPAIGRGRLHIDKAAVSDLQLRNLMSWLFHAKELVARAEVPGGVEVSVSYSDEELVLGGGFAGSRPISIPFQWPDIDPDASELSQVISLLRSLATSLAPEIAKRKAKNMWEDAKSIFD